MRTGAGGRRPPGHPGAHTWGRPIPRGPRRLPRLTGELLAPNGGLHHRPTDGADHDPDAIDEGDICGGDPRLQYHGRGVGGKGELALKV
jgi:hypothetical protein